MKLHEMIQIETDACRDGESITPYNLSSAYYIRYLPDHIQTLIDAFSNIPGHDAYLIGLMAGFELTSKYDIPDDLSEILIYE